MLWLLALVLPLQGSAAVVFGAMGPAHAHRAASAAAPVLEDLRRWRPAVQPAASGFAALGLGHAHAHAGNAVQRHYHARTDGSVVPADLGDVGDTDEGAGVSAVAVLALLPRVAAWAPPGAASADASRPFWAELTGFMPRRDRPPKRQG